MKHSHYCRTILYTPDAGFSGADTITYTIIDPLGATGTAIINVAEGASNQKPIAGTDQNVLLDEKRVDVINESYIGRVVATLGASDPDGDPIIYEIIEDNSGGRFVMSGDDLVIATENIDYEQLGDAQWTVKVRVTDPQADTDEVTINIDLEDVFEDIFLDDGNNVYTDQGDKGDTIIGLDGDDTITGDDYGTRDD